LGIVLARSINRPFDFYLLAEAPPAMYTIFLNGRVQTGIQALYRNLPSVQAPFASTVTPSAIVPPSMRGAVVTFYAVAVEAGKTPPVAGPSSLTPATQYVIALDRKSRQVI